MRLKLSPLTVEISFSKGLVWVIWQPVTILLGHNFFLSVLPLYFFHGNKKLSEFLCVYSTDSVLGCVIFLHISLVLQNSLELFHNQHHLKKPDCRNTLTFPNQSQLALNPKAFCQHLYQMTHYICLYLVCLSCLPSLVFLSLIMHTWNCLEAEPWVFLGRPMPALCFLGIADTCLVLANSYCFSCLVLKWRSWHLEILAFIIVIIALVPPVMRPLSLLPYPISSYMSRFESRGSVLRVTTIALFVLQSTAHSSALRPSFLDIPSTGLFNHCSVP